MALCTITGFVYMPNGQPAADRLFKFKPSRKGIVADYFGAVVPEVIESTTDSLGFLTVQLLTGNYVAFSALYNGPVVVPDAEEASLYEVFGGTGSVTPPDIAPNFTVLPSLLGSTALGGVITVDLGSATGSPEPVITGTLTRPGASPVAVTQGQQITVQAGDQGGSLSLTATATNSAGVDTETVSRAIPAAIPAPVFTTPLADVVLTVGDADVVVNLDDYADNATSYSVSPAGGAVAISGSSMAVSADAEVDQNYTVTATGPGGTATDSFGVLVEAGDVSAQRVILVTDYAGDCDDAPAVLLACDAHEKGDINLLGIVASSTVATSAPGVYGQLAAYNMTSIPVYAYQGSTGTYNNRISAPVRDRFGVAGQTRTAFPDDVTGLRTMLAAAPNASVKMIDVGAPISTSRLLDSPADAISPLTGRELVAAKVVGLWMMAGEFTSTRVEYNANRDVASTQNVYQTWPTPIYAHGAEVGGTVLTAPMADANPLIDPVKVAFDAFDAASPSSLRVYLGRRARWSWDPICVHHAIYGNQNLYNLAGANGTISVSSTGVTSWSDTPAGNKSYVGKVASDATIAAAIQSIIDNTTVMQNLDANVPGQVAQPAATGSGLSRTITWAKPDTGGSPILSYAIRIDGSVVGTVAGNVLAYTAGDLATGERQITVAATNGRGEGQQSPARTVTISEAMEPSTSTAFALTEGAGNTMTSAAGVIATADSIAWATNPVRVNYGSGNSRILVPPPATETDHIFAIVCRLDSVSGDRVFVGRRGNDGARQSHSQFRSTSGRLEYVSFPYSETPPTADFFTAATGTVVAGEWSMFLAYSTVDRMVLRKNGVVLLDSPKTRAQNRNAIMSTVGHTVGTRWSGSTYTNPIVGDIAAFDIKYAATTVDVAAVETRLRQIASQKGITLP